MTTSMHCKRAACTIPGVQRQSQPESTHPTATVSHAAFPREDLSNGGTLRCEPVARLASCRDSDRRKVHAYLVHATSCVLGSKAPCGAQAQDPEATGHVGFLSVRVH